MARPPASEQVQVNFRMPADLKARIEAAAEANSRTTTAELVATLEEKYPAPADDFEAKMRRGQELLNAARAHLDVFSDGKPKDADQLKAASEKAKELLAEYHKLFPRS